MKPLLCSFGTAKKERFMVEAHEILDKQKKRRLNKEEISNPIKSQFEED